MHFLPGMMNLFPVLAYVDPSAGGLLLQIIFGGLAGLLVIIKLQWVRISMVFGRLFGKKASTQPIDSGEPKA